MVAWMVFAASVWGVPDRGMPRYDVDVIEENRVVDDAGKVVATYWNFRAIQPNGYYRVMAWCRSDRILSMTRRHHGCDVVYQGTRGTCIVRAKVYRGTIGYDTEVAEREMWKGEAPPGLFGIHP